jgi:hypothetical protein
MRESLGVVVMLEDHIAVATGPDLFPSGIMRSDNLAWLPNSLDGPANPGGKTLIKAVHLHNITLINRRVFVVVMFFHLHAKCACKRTGLVSGVR